MYRWLDAKYQSTKGIPRKSKKGKEDLMRMKKGTGD